MKSKIKMIYFFAVAYCKNFLIEKYNARIENKKRHWKAYGTFGGGVVPLGKINQTEAIETAKGLGTVVYCDPEQAAIFYSSNK